MKILLKPNDQASLDDACATLRLASADGRPMEITIKRMRKRRSLDQNGRMWALYEEIQVQVFDSHCELVPANDIHEHHMKETILGMRTNALGFKVPHSTTGLTTTQMTDYQDHVMQIAADDWGVDWGTDWGVSFEGA